MRPRKLGQPHKGWKAAARKSREMPSVWYRVTILCGCGRIHPSFEEWRQCPMALSTKPNDVWWRVLAPDHKPA